MAIKVTPEELKSMAQKLNGYASETTALAGKIKAAVSQALSTWEGKSQKDYEARFKEIDPIISKTLPDLIASMAAEAERKAEKFLQADQ